MARGSIIKHANGDGSITYYIKYRDPTGKQRKKAIGPKKKDAEKALAEMIRKITLAEYQELPDITFAELAEKWLNLKTSEVRPKTMVMYKSHFNLRLIPTFGDYRLKSINQEMVEDFAGALRQEEISSETNRKCLLSLKTVLNKAVEWGYISKNPAEFVKPPKRHKKEIEILTPEEMKLLIGATDEKHRTLILTACYTGMRISELFGLKWADINFSNSKVNVRQTNQQGKFYDTKSATSRRTIIVPNEVIQALKEHQARQAVELESNEDDLVFTNSIGKPLHYQNLLRRVFEPALKRAGLKRVGFHALRHSYSAALITAGENIKYIQRQLGHSSIQQTLGTYGHLLPDIEKDACNRLSKIFGTMVVP